MKNSIIILCLFCFPFYHFFSQKKSDTLQSWINKFYQFGEINCSPNGRWLLAKKFYDNNNDTIVVLDNRRPESPIGHMIGFASKQSFINEEGILGSNERKAEFWNLKTNKRFTYENIKTADPLAKLNRYAVLDNNENLSVYSVTGEKILQVSDIKGWYGYATDSERNLYAIRKGKDNYEVLDLSGNSPLTVYKTDGEIKRIELSTSKKFLFISMIDKPTGKLRIAAVNTSSHRLSNIEGLFPDDTYVTSSEIQNGKAYLFIIENYTPSSKDKLVDIWYGNETDFEAEKVGRRNFYFLFWSPETGDTQTLPTERYHNFESINSTEFLLAFNSNEGHNYITSHPQYSAYIYNLTKKDYIKLGDLKEVDVKSPEIVNSPNGKYILFSEGEKKWTLAEMDNLKKTVIDKVGLVHPMFSEDAQSILFESDNDVWKYDIPQNKLYPLKIAAGKQTKITTYKERRYSSFNISTRTYNDAEPILVKTYNADENTTSYFQWYKGKVQKLLNETSNRIKALMPDKNFSKFYGIEENYNFPTRLFVIDSRTKTKKRLYTNIKEDKETFNLKQEIIHYTNSDGKPLKGILYYPENFSSSKKYPMVVYIYQVQNSKSNEYLSPGYSALPAINIRALLKKGYFVYLPDIIYNKAGTGLSALDCVNKSLDAIKSYESINMNKVGLSGQSHGGYETNFIATHSNRFTAYISEAGNSDIVRSYFSFNYNFDSPFYWQYENGQYEMNVPFSQNKELYFKNNPIYYVENVNAPILLCTGMKDENIEWDQTMEFYIGLKRNNKQVIALFYPNTGHGISVYNKEGKDLYIRILEWWDYFLQDKKDVDWINKQMINE